MISHPTLPLPSKKRRKCHQQGGHSRLANYSLVYLQRWWESRIPIDIFDCCHVVSDIEELHDIGNLAGLFVLIDLSECVLLKIKYCTH